MPPAPELHKDLIERYDQPGPRYTSFPPATEFHDKISEREFHQWAQISNEDLIPKPLSLYFHIPFCSSICYYCACNKVITKKREKAIPYLEDLYREIELKSLLFNPDREVQQLHWGGGTPEFLSREQSRQLMQKIAQHFNLRPATKFDYSIEIDPRVTKPGGIQHLKSIGFNRISIGVQDLDERVQQAINRRQSLEMTVAVINEARRAGIRSINLDLIYGLPFQTKQSFSQTLETLIELGPDRFAIYNYAHLPHRFPPQRRINCDDLPSSDEKIAMLGSAIEKLGRAGYEYIGMDHFARSEDDLAIAQRNRNLHRNFQGYSSHAQCDTVGFGVSAISQVSDHFSQNATDLDSYSSSLRRGKLPVARGFECNSEDLLRREIIQSLICHFHLDIRALEKQWNIDFAISFAQELACLEEMQDHGLVDINENEILVLPNGRLLVRNICMAFDPYRRKADAGGTFSRTI